MQANLIQNSFLYGEVSKNLYGRTDSPAYNAGAKTFRNYVVKKLGGATRRPGTIYDFEVKDSSKATRIVPFEYRDERFLLEFGEYYIRFHKQTSSGFTLVTDDGWTFPYAQSVGGRIDNYFTSGLVFNEMSIYNAPVSTGFGPVQLTTTGTLPTGLAVSTDYWLIVFTESPFMNSVYPPYGDSHDFVVEFATSRTNALNGTAIAISGGSGIHTLTVQPPAYEIPTDYAESDLPNLRFSQDDNMLIVVDGAHQPARLIKLDNYLAGTGSDAKWRLEIQYDYVGPWRHASPTANAADAAIVVTLIGGTGLDSPGAQVALSLVAGASWPPGSLLLADFLRDDDRLLVVDDAQTSWAVLQIYDESLFRALVRAPFTSSSTSPVTASSYWMLNAWSDSTGYPRCVAVSNARINFAGGGADQHVIYFSSLDGRPNFWPINNDGTVTSSTAFSADIFGDKDVGVIAMIAIWDLFVITGNGVWSLGPNNGTALTAATVSAHQISTYGGNTVDPVASERVMTYISRTGKRAYGIVFKQNATDQDVYGVNDLTLYSDHILDAGVRRMAYQQEPYSTIWFVLDDGYLASMTLHSEEGTVGWAGHSIAGTSDPGTSVVVEDIVSIPSFDGTNQNVYLLVKRTINGFVVRYVEHISQFVRSGDLGDFLYLDCAATYSGGATQTPSGFDNLEGETVHVVSDDVYVGTFAVASGQIDLGAGNTGSEVHAGFTYNSDLETLTPEVQTPFGTVQGSLKRIARSVLRVQNAKSGKIGRDASNLDPIEYEATALFTGDVEIPVEIGSERNPTLYVRQDLPYPLDIDAIVTRVDLESRGGP